MNNFTQRVATINDILCSVNLLTWDSRVIMPKGGAATRGNQIASLQAIAREKIIDPYLEEQAHNILATSASELETKAAQEVVDAIEYHKRIPLELLMKQAEQSAISGQAWQEARQKSDFAHFQPHLQNTVKMSRELSAQFDAAHPYDPMLSLYEPEETSASISKKFDHLRAALLPIIEKNHAAEAPRTDFLTRNFPVESQKAFSHELANILGYDLNHGRIDTANHPFEISFTREDVRVTSRWSENFLPSSIFGTLHEIGHAMYEMGISPDFTRSIFTTDLRGLYAVGGTSFSMHESQSRLIENHVGRSQGFWDNHYDLLQSYFSSQLGDVSKEEFVKAINHSKPSLIRVESDELTYDLHIMLRVRLEMALMEGSIEVADLPALWNESIESDLGIQVPNDGLGVLQDIHWSTGYIGSFPTYTIGNITAAQVMNSINNRQPDITQAVKQGNIHPLKDELTQQIWTHGRSKTRKQLLTSMGIDSEDITPYVNYLKSKFL
ncbi:carboxypeptidase M32 [Vibrio sp. MA40-2]|uniref:carboxypeptidase M32 n=1 Tax=Vibrio sp. MA40-2 TaxID=3391828 RepID=UPI0039A6FF6C